MKIFFAFLISIAAAGIYYNVYLKITPLQTTMVYPEPKMLPDFKLIDQHNQPFTNAQLMGKWSVLFFGFTTCPDICPTTMTILAQVANKLDPLVLQKIQFIFVSIDPERDTPELLEKYIPFYHPDFIALTGAQQQLSPFSLSLGAMYMKLPIGDTYTMSHSSTLFIVDPKGRRYGIFSKTASGVLEVAAITQDLETIVNSY